MTASPTAMIRKLNEYCFRNIWNEVRAEGIANVQLTLYDPRFLVAGISDTIFLSFPTPSDQYALYYVPKSVFGGALQLPQDQWISAQDAINFWNFQTNVYPLNGKTAPKAYTYFQSSSTNDYLWVVIQKTALVKTIGLVDYQSMYLSIYLDGPDIGPVYSRGYLVPTQPLAGLPVLTEITTQITAYRILNQAGLIITVNGYEQDSYQTVNITYGDYVDLVCDTNIIGGFLVNVSNSTTGYLSSVDSAYREVIHIPKSMNPNNQLITHNTCTFYVRDNVQNKGLYYHRVDPRAVRQITHNDFGLKTTVIQDLRNILSQDNVSVYARIRSTARHRLLQNDAYYLSILYTASDADILLFLTGRKNAELSFWCAAELEQNGYIALMFSVPTLNDPTLLSKYITALGYYEVASILGAHIQTETVNNNATMFFEKGFGFQHQNSYPLVYLNDRKVNSDKIKYSNYTWDKIAVAIDTSIQVMPSSKVTLSLLEGGSSTPMLFTPTAGTSTISVPWNDVLLYKAVPSTPLRGYQTSTSVVWQQIQPSPGMLILTPAVDGLEVTAGMSLYGEQLLIKPAHYVKTYLNVVDVQLAARQPLIFTLEEECDNNPSTVVPLLGYNTLNVYVNGYKLINQLDYTGIPMTDAGGNIGLVQVVVSNMQYLDLNAINNTIEIVAHTTDTIEDESGYGVNGLISYDTSVNFVYPGLTETTLLGCFDTTPVNNGNTITPSLPMQNGNPYEIFSTISHTVKESLAGYETTVDLTRVAAINAYYYETQVIDTSLVIIQQSYQTYSPYLTQIIYDVVRGNLVISNDPDTNMFLNQFVDYEYLKQRDPAFSSGSVVNKRYVDINPVYGTVTLPIVDYYAPLHRLVQLTLGVDLNTLGEILDG